jgi:mevalonate kinase
MDNSKWLLSEEQIGNAIPKHRVQRSWYRKIAQAQLDYLIAKNWKSPEEYQKVIEEWKLTREALKLFIDSNVDEHARTLRAVTDALRKKDWFGEKLSYNERLKVLRYIESGEIIKSGQEPEGMER